MSDSVVGPTKAEYFGATVSRSLFRRTTQKATHTLLSCGHLHRPGALHGDKPQNRANCLPHEDEKLARETLLVGRVIDEHKSEFARGDYLIQDIIGVDRQSGAVGVAGMVRVGTTIQFHVRDAASADEDLHKLLGPHANTGVRGAMLFGCNGRGTNMWPKPGHDFGVMHELLDNVPTAGFFCGGEFGPVGGKNFVHGFTAGMALFREQPEVGT